MKLLKGFVFALIITTLLLTGAYAGTTEIDTDYSFEDEKEYFGTMTLDAEVMAQLERYFNEAMALEAKEDYDAAEANWDAYYVLLEEHVDFETCSMTYEDYDTDLYEDYTFEDEKEFLNELDLDAEIITTLEKLYDEATALEVTEDYDAAEVKWDAYYNLIDEQFDFDSEMFEDYTFEEEKEFLNELNLDTETLTALEKLFDEATALEATEDYDAAEVKWDAYYNLLDEQFDFDSEMYEDYTFEEEKEFLNELDLDAETLSALEKLFNEAVALEATEDFDAAEAKWDAYYDYLEPFDEENVELSAVYKVINNKLVLSVDEADYYGETPKTLSQEDKLIHQKIWKRVSTLIPTSQLKYFKSLEIGTDGKEGTLASVVELDNLSQWALFLDTEDSIMKDNTFSDEFDFTVIHELGHVVTLNSSQLSEDEIKNTYSTDEGYSKKDSYINAFYNTFWKTNDITEDPYDRYDDNMSHYVSDYAATNIEEDMAESFASFVMNHKPEGRSIADQKIQFFYKYPELVTLRVEIRKSL